MIEVSKDYANDKFSVRLASSSHAFEVIVITIFVIHVTRSVK